MTRKVRYLGDVNCGPSPAIFGDLGTLRGEADQGMCVLLDEDFIVPRTLTSGTSNGGYLMLSTNGTSTGKGVNDTDKELGVQVLTLPGADKNSCNIQFGEGNQWRLDNTAGNTSKVGWEFRFRQSTVAANTVSMAIGLQEGPVTATMRSADGEVRDSYSFLGFRSLNTDPQNMDAIYQDTGATDPVVILANAATIAANTYSKVGFLFDPYELDSAKAATYFVDGVAVAYINTTQVDTSTFPEGEGMVPAIQSIVNSATAATVDLDRVTGVMFKNAVQ